jgi:hypothetical protein
MRKFGLVACVLILVLTSSGSPAWAARAARPGPQTRPDGATAGIRTVTLVTGDRVVLQELDGPDRVVKVQPGKGRKGMAFRRSTENGDTFVIPADAGRLVAQKRVDRRLFNVSKLVELGYDDSRAKTVPLIVARPGGAKSLRSLGAGALEVSKADASAFWRDAVKDAKLWLDGPVKATLDRSVAQIGAPTAWQLGHKGAGAVVAVLDTGIDTKHPDLADGAVIAERDFSESETGPADLFGHGTHVAGIITGNGAAGGGKYLGVAPDAKLLNGKVLNDFGGGRESWIIAGMEWAAAQGADVINMSLGSSFPSDGTEPMDLAVNRLTAETGVLFVVSAGNSGPDPQSIGSPAAADAALTVGAVDRADGLAEFSSRGPRWSNLDIKPDITAPGVDIASALADDSLLGEFYPVVDERYLILSGTSMAAPHSAGAAAILAGQHPDWDADELKPALTGAAKPNPGLSVYEQGAGRLDVARAVTQTVRATTGSVNNGIVRWPHQDDVPITKEISYRNDGDAPVTLDLSVSVPNAPAGMFTLDQPRLTVPARGTATARVTTDTRVPAPDGVYGGYVVAGVGEVSVRTAIGVTREVESYDVTLDVIDRAGQPTPEYFVRFVSITAQQAVVPYDESGHVVARVPKGRHYLDVDVSTPNPESPRGWDTTAIVEPELNVTGDLTLTLDARQAKPVGLRIDRPEAREGDAIIGFARDTDWGSTGSFWITGSFDSFFVRPSSTTAPAGKFEFGLTGVLARPDGQGGFVESPYLYHVEWIQDGRVPTELQPRVRDRDLVRVQTHIAATAPDEKAAKDWVAQRETPAVLAEYYTPGIPWYNSMVLNLDPESFDFDGVISTVPTTYRQGGKPLVEQWNMGVFGPAFPPGSLDAPFAARLGDEMDVYLPLFSDQPPGHQGVSVVATTQMTMSRNGEVIGESPDYFGFFEVPAGAGDYRLAVTSTRESTLSTRVSAVWTFRSDTVAGEEPKPLPLMAVRFAPELDQHNRAKAGRPLVVPVHVQQHEDAGMGSLRRLDIDVSYDDGASWRRVPVLGVGLDRLALVAHPAGSGFVSLRARATDNKGNAVEQTIIRAYAITR